MKIGIVSDSHGKADRLRRALHLLRERGAEVLVHCGDVGSADCVAALAETRLPAYAVAGNMDRHVRRLGDEAVRCGVHFSDDAAVVDIGGGRLLGVVHGNDEAALSRLLADERVVYLCRGHTHRRSDDRAGGTRIINPGALHHARPATVALLDTESDTLESIEVR